MNATGKNRSGNEQFSRNLSLPLPINNTVASECWSRSRGRIFSRSLVTGAPWVPKCPRSQFPSHNDAVLVSQIRIRIYGNIAGHRQPLKWNLAP